MTDITTALECPFCDGSGLGLDGESSCRTCGGSGTWADAARAVLPAVAYFMGMSDNPYRHSAARRDLDTLMGRADE